MSVHASFFSDVRSIHSYSSCLCGATHFKDELRTLTRRTISPGALLISESCSCKLSPATSAAELHLLERIIDCMQQNNMYSYCTSFTVHKLCLFGQGFPG